MTSRAPGIQVRAEKWNFQSDISVFAGNSIGFDIVADSTTIRQSLKRLLNLLGPTIPIFATVNDFDAMKTFFVDEN